MSTEPQQDRVVVIGGGVIGLSCAYQLARAGHPVTVLERNRIGRGASFGNAGWIVPSLVHPFNAPGAVPQALRAMLDPHSPIALRQLPTWGLARWASAFLRASRPARSHTSLAALAVLAADATDRVIALAEEIGFEVHHSGLLVPFRSQAALDAYRRAHREVEALGYRGRVHTLDGDAARAREPSLADDVVGALHLLDEASVRPDSMTAALARAVAAAGGELIEHEAAHAVVAEKSGRWRVVTQSRSVVADAVVVAAGEDTAALLRGLNVRVPLQSGRGCSVTLPPGVVTLRQPLKIAEHRVACTPFGTGEVRLSGTFDLVRPGAGTSVGRMRGVLDDAGTHLPAVRDVAVSDLQVWSGARPCTPDSVPIVGPVGRAPGLFVATGHGTLGMTLAVTTGQTITRLVSTALARPTATASVDIALGGSDNS